MNAELLHIGTIASGTFHLGFTSLCQWRGNYYVSYRKALSHGITPKGSIVVKTCDTAYDTPSSITDENGWLQYSHDITHPDGDCRDPRLVPTKEALWMMCGCYLPAPQYTNFSGLSNISSDNLIVTHLTYTTNGYDWAPLIPILAPQHWGWSILPLNNGYLLASYVTGKTHESASIVLWSGQSLLNLLPLGTMYEGASIEKEDTSYRYPDRSPSEMVLYHPSPDTVACFLRTTTFMNLGISPTSRLDWRWRTCNKEIIIDDDGTPAWYATNDMIHPSAILKTNHGWILAVRRCKPVYKAVAARKKSQIDIDHYVSTTDLYEVHGQYVKHRLTLPSGGDCAYAGLCHGINEDEIFVSYYSQHEYDKQGEFGTTLPSSNIYLANVKITP